MCYRWRRQKLHVLGSATKQWVRAHRPPTACLSVVKAGSQTGCILSHGRPKTHMIFLYERQASEYPDPKGKCFKFTPRMNAIFLPKSFRTLRIVKFISVFIFSNSLGLVPADGLAFLPSCPPGTGFVHSGASVPVLWLGNENLAYIRICRHIQICRHQTGWDMLSFLLLLEQMTANLVA